jgi:hypothetical protein
MDVCCGPSFAGRVALVPGQLFASTWSGLPRANPDYVCSDGRRLVRPPFKNAVLICLVCKAERGLDGVLPKIVRGCVVFLEASREFRNCGG